MTTSRQDDVERIRAILQGVRETCNPDTDDGVRRGADALYAAGLRLSPGPGLPVVSREKGHPTKCPKCGEEFIDLMSEVVSGTSINSV